MAKRFPSLCLALFVAASAAAAPLRVRRVVDGDTLLLSNGERVRLIGVDTPEVHPSRKLDRDAARSRRDRRTIQALGRQAAAFTGALVAGREVRLAYDPANRASGHRDRYGRTLAYVYFKPAPCESLDRWVADAACELSQYDGGFLNALIVEAGYGNAYTRYPFKFLDQFRALERAAREQERGLWRPGSSPRSDAARRPNERDARGPVFVGAAAA